MTLQLRTLSLAFALLAIVLAPAAFAGDSIDFTKPPAQGAKFKITESTKVSMEGNVDAGGQEVAVKQSMSVAETYTQKYVEVKDGKIVMIERQYEDSGMKVKIEMEGRPEMPEQEIEQPIAWKTLRGKWQDDEFQIEVKDGDDWKAPDEKIAGRYTSVSFRNPFISLPKTAKKVGESWELDDEEFAKFYSPSTFGADEGAEVEGGFKATLTAIQEVDGLECGIIKFNMNVSLTMGEGQSMTFKIDGIANYSIQHAFVVGVKSKGTVGVKIEMEQAGMEIKQSLEGPVTRNAKVEIVEDDE